MSTAVFNQSAEIKYATLLLCNALETIESGRIAKARQMIDEAMCILPDVDNPVQKKAIRRHVALVEHKRTY